MGNLPEEVLLLGDIPVLALLLAENIDEIGQRATGVVFIEECLKESETFHVRREGLHGGKKLLILVRF